jgi:DNA-binding PadR family transcriptional regulator
MSDDLGRIIANFSTELRRGSLIIAVLRILQEKHYGYELLALLEEHGIGMDANTLYPLLRRLEAQGLLSGTWDTSESRPRKYFILSENGHTVYHLLTIEWEKLSKTITNIINYQGGIVS